MADSRILLSKEEAKRKADEKAAQVGIVFENIITGESRVASSAEHIAAFYNSSDLGPNAKNKQDHGWRLAPEVVVEVEAVKEDLSLMSQIAATYQIPIDDLVDFNILKYLADRKFKSVAREQQAKDRDYASDYERRLAEAREKANKSEVAEADEKADNSGKAK